MKFTFLSIVLLLFIVPVFSQQYGLFKDPVNNHNYKTVKIGDQVWMEENLDATRFRNGDIIPEAKTKEEFIKVFIEKKAAWCYIFSDDKVRSKLYNYWATIDPRGLAPKGWHIPNQTEFGELSSHYDKIDKSIYDSASKTINDSINAIKESKKIAKRISDSIKLANKSLDSNKSVLNSNEIVYNQDVAIEDDVDLLEEKPFIPFKRTNSGILLRTVGWGGGTNQSGFNAKPITGIQVVGKLFGEKGVNGNAQNLSVKYEIKGLFPNTQWWLRKEPNESYLRYFYLKESSLYISSTSGTDKENFFHYALPVRCIKD
jgi:uncharacterized protein (TIGR02145 family)